MSGGADASAALPLRPIAHVRTPFPEKFGIPRQSGLIPGLRGTVVFEPPYRAAEALRGLEAFSHVWLIWGFSQHCEAGWHPTVRPPRLGGNRRLGVFATRSPFRPNPLGLSCVRLLAVQPEGPEGPTLLVGGADLADGTPIYDIKPYVPYADCVPEATGGFAPEAPAATLAVTFPPELLMRLAPEEREPLLAVLAHDPRPAYRHTAPEEAAPADAAETAPVAPPREYGLAWGAWNVRFTVEGTELHVRSLERRTRGG